MFIRFGTGDSIAALTAAQVKVHTHGFMKPDSNPEHSIRQVILCCTYGARKAPVNQTLKLSCSLANASSSSLSSTSAGLELAYSSRISVRSSGSFSTARMTYTGGVGRSAWSHKTISLDHMLAAQQQCNTRTKG